MLSLGISTQTLDVRTGYGEPASCERCCGTTGYIGGKPSSKRLVLSRCMGHWKERIVLQGSRRSSRSISNPFRPDGASDGLTKAQIVGCGAHSVLAASV